MCCGTKNREGVRRGGDRRELKKRGRGMKGRVDKSRGIVTLIPETLSKINPKEPFRFVKGGTRRSETDQIPRVILRLKH